MIVEVEPGEAVTAPVAHDGDAVGTYRFASRAADGTAPTGSFEVR